MAKIIFTFVSGFDAQKEFIFDLTPGLKVTIGRELNNNIVVNEKEDTVSRLHATVQTGEALANQIILIDSSANGTFVNDIKIVDKHELQQDDIIRLGKGGPTVSARFDPPRTKATRMVNLEAISKATRQVNSSEAATLIDKSIAEQPRGIGKETLERKISEVRTDVTKKTNRKYGTAAMLGLASLVCLGGISYYMFNEQNIKNDADRIEAEKKLAGVKAKMTAEEAGSAAAIKSDWSASVVQIEAVWRLESNSGEPVYHEVDDKTGRIALYRKTASGKVTPKLTTTKTIYPIGGTHVGTGFVVSPAGHIMTYQDVAAGWTKKQEINYPGYLLDLKGKIIDAKFVPKEYFQFDSNQVAGKSGESNLIGRNLSLNVLFPNSNIRVPATLGALAPDHAVALMKIDPPATLKAVKLGDSKNITSGIKIVQLGYPVASRKIQRTEQKQDDVGGIQISTAKDVSVSEGVISKHVPRVESASSIRWNIESGDYLELDIRGGEGSNGSPVFNKSGEVIGILGNAFTSSNDKVMLAVPINYGVRLLDPSKSVFQK